MTTGSAAWPVVSLGEICEFKYGKSLTEAKRIPGNVPVFGSNGVVGLHSDAITQGATIIIGRKGSLGQVNFSTAPCWPIDTTYYVDESATKANLRWLAHRLTGLGLSRLNKAAAVPGLNREDAYRQQLILPPLSEQRRIAEILDRAEALRAKRRAALAQLDILTQSIFLDMFGDPAANPRGWQRIPIGNLATKFSDGPFGSNLKTSHYQDHGIRVIRLQNIGNGEFLDADKAYISERHFVTLAKHECHPGDVLVATLGDPNLRACIQPDWLPVALNKADCVQLRPNPHLVNAAYVSALLNQPGTLRMAHGLILGETRARISMGRLRHLQVPVPHMELQREFEVRIETIEHTKGLQRRSAHQLDSLFTSIQHRAFRGEI